MELEFKKDFEQAQSRWVDFWEGRLAGRPALLIVTPKNGVEPAPKPPYACGADGNFGPWIDQLLAWASTHEFLDMAIPLFYLEFGPDHFSSLLGADMKFLPDSLQTSWAEPFVRDWDDADIRFRPDSKWWARTVEFAHALRRRCDGRLLIASPTLVASLDCLAAIRGVNELLLDLVISPDKVHAALARVRRAHEEILQALSELLDYKTFGSINRHGMYSPGKVNVPQCDFSCMISPAMFAEFELPNLRREAQSLDAAEYHLDGPGALVHLEAVCSVEDIDVIQWVPGTGEAETRDWSDLYLRIDQLGKGQIRYAGTAEDIRVMMRRYRSPKVFYCMTANSRREGLAILDQFD